MAKLTIPLHTASKHEQVIALSRAGNTSKIHLVVGSYGLPIEFFIICYRKQRL